MRADAVGVEQSLIAQSLGRSCLAVGGVYKLGNGLDAWKHTDKKSDFATDINGARGEMAAAKYLGVYFEPRNMDFKGPDVGRECQVRSTVHENGCLIIRPNDAKPQKHKFILAVTPPGLTVYLVGWRYGDECRKDEFIR